MVTAALLPVIFLGLLDAGPAAALVMRAQAGHCTNLVGLHKGSHGPDYGASAIDPYYPSYQVLSPGDFPRAIERGDY